MAVSKTRRRVYAYDWIIDSQFPVPGSVSLSLHTRDSTAKAGIEILSGQVEIPAKGEILGLYRLHGQTLYFPVDRHIFDSGTTNAKFSCHADGRIIVETRAGSGADDDAVGRLLIASALPAVLWMQKQMVLHAGAVLLPGKSNAIAISGASGNGKSTVLAQLIKSGASLIADDTARISSVGRQPIIDGLPGGYFLCPDKEGRKSVRTFHPVAETRQIRSAPLTTILHLAPPDDRTNCEFVKVSGVEAFQLLLNARHRQEVVRLLGDEQFHMGAMAGTSQCLTIYRWFRKNGAIDLDKEELEFLNSVTN